MTANNRNDVISYLNKTIFRHITLVACGFAFIVFLLYCIKSPKQNMKLHDLIEFVIILFTILLPLFLNSFIWSIIIGNKLYNHDGITFVRILAAISFGIGFIFSLISSVIFIKNLDNKLFSSVPNGAWIQALLVSSGIFYLFLIFPIKKTLSINANKQ